MLVTGATGTVGRTVAELLHTHGIAVRAGSRKPGRAATSTSAPVPAVRPDLKDAATWPAARITLPEATSLQRDWTGTAAADLNIAAATDIYALTGLAQDQWAILAVDILSLGGSPEEVFVYALDRRKNEGAHTG